MRRAIVLFDIDGTLVDCAGAGRRSMVAAFHAVTGRADALDQVRFGGMTDRVIVKLGVEAVGRPTTQAVCDAILDAYVAVLPKELTRASVRVYDGAEELVARAHAAGHAVGLGTGNIRAGAQAKLERVGLWGRFDFGGFGCDAELRDDVLACGRARGLAWLEARSSIPDAESTVLVVGDTPRDVASAHAIGARCLAVATGAATRADLEAAGAELVVDALTDPAAVRWIEAAGV
ncbi:MAG: haloacid dehalogenase-like hydrolase [Polyangiaceae bacterium]